jgi:hypothetical protein
MKVISPLAVTDAMLISSTAPETDYAAWAAGTTYAAGAFVIRTSTHRIYQSLQATNLGKTPETNPPWWLDWAPTNRWAMFDQQVSTATALASPLSVTLAPGYINSLALLGLVGQSAQITMTDGAAGPTVYTKTVNLEGAVVGDWYQYFFEPHVQLGEVVLTDLPTYSTARLTVAIASGAATVGCGGMVVGTVYDLGGTQFGAKVGIIDYSRKETDSFGTTTFVKRAYSKRMSADLIFAAPLMNKVQQVLAGLRATPCVWIGAEGPTYAPLVVFGFYRDFGVTVAYPTYSLCNLEIEGLI